MTPAIKVKDNLFLVGSKIFSFETHVGDVVGRRIIPLGKFSRTTTKHINHISSLLGFPIGESKDLRIWFYKYEMGVKCTADNLLSNRLGNRILSHMKEGKTFLEALCTVPKSEIPKVDLSLVEKYLDKFKAPEEVELLRTINSIS